jgi:Isochorismatase family
LRNLGTDTIVIAGTLTNFCCGTMARQGYERGVHVIVGSDITATDDPVMQGAELRVLRKGFARVMTSVEICTISCIMIHVRTNFKRRRRAPSCCDPRVRGYGNGAGNGLDIRSIG